MSFFEELKRRNVFRVAAAYVVAGWLLMQVTDVFAPALRLPEWFPTAVAFLLLAGLPVVLFFAWAYEITPDGIKKEAEVERSTSISRETAAKLNRLTIALIIAAIAVVALDRLIPEQGSNPELGPGSTTGADSQDPSPTQATVVEPGTAIDAAPSVAVLPFVNMSSDPEQEFFSDGISEEILNVLTRIPNLKVAARTSSFQFKGQTLDIADIAEQLKVNHILEGSVRKAGDQLRITAQLIEAESGYHLWSDTYDRKLEDVFAIQDEIAAAIAGELRARLSGDPIEARQAVDVRAYELYLKGLGLVATRKENELFEAFEVLQTALEIEPDFVAAMVTLARGYAVAPYFTHRVPVTELREQGRLWASKALELEPGNAEALSVLAIVVNEQDTDPDQALSLLHEAFRSSPGNLSVNNFLGDVLFRVGALDESIIYESRATELDPLAPVHLSDLAFPYLLKGEYARALELSELALQQNPAFPNAHQGKIESYWALGDFEKLERAVNAQIESGGLSEFGIVTSTARLALARGDADLALEKLLDAYDMAKTNTRISVRLAFEATIHRNFDIAGEMLLKAHATKSGNWTFPLYVRLPEQAPDSGPWQEFWALPGPARMAELRRANGLSPHYPAFGEASR